MEIVFSEREKERETLVESGYKEHNHHGDSVTWIPPKLLAMGAQRKVPELELVTDCPQATSRPPPSPPSPSLSLEGTEHCSH